MKFIKKYMLPLTQLFEKYRVEKAWVFGSVLRPKDFKETSDIDLIVQFNEEGLPPEDVGELNFNLTDALEELFHRRVDLIRDRPFKNPYFKEEVEKTKLLIYEHQATKIFV